LVTQAARRTVLLTIEEHRAVPQVLLRLANIQNKRSEESDDAAIKIITGTSTSILSRTFVKLSARRAASRLRSQCPRDHATA
jgi:hypothetical protein